MNSIINVDVFGADAGDPAGPRPGPHADSRNLMQGTRIRYNERNGAKMKHAAINSEKTAN